MSNEKIKEHYVREGEIDKFTKIAEYEMLYPRFTLESQLITEYIQSKDELAATFEQLTGKKRKGGGNSSLRMELSASKRLNYKLNTLLEKVHFKLKACMKILKLIAILLVIIPSVFAQKLSVTQLDNTQIHQINNVNDTSRQEKIN